jgi:CRP-like cAMP-binding protein
MAMRTVVAPALRLSLTDQQSLIPHAKMVRYGADEVVQYVGEVPTAMTFLIEGRIRLTTTTEDGSVIPLSLLEEGSFLGLTTLTRQPSLSGAYALEEVTALEIAREHIEDLVLRTPLLLQELGRIIEDRRKETSRAGSGRPRATAFTSIGVVSTQR